MKTLLLCLHASVLRVFSGRRRWAASLEGPHYHVDLVGELVGADKHIYCSGNNRNRKTRTHVSLTRGEKKTPKSVATILGLIRGTLWSGWNRECQASENTSQDGSTGSGSRELFSIGGFDGSGPVIKQPPFTWVTVGVRVSIYANRQGVQAWVGVYD